MPGYRAASELSVNELLLMANPHIPESHLPPLPELPQDPTLLIFTDKSLREGSSSNDNETLSILGASAVKTAVSTILLRRRPPPSPQELLVGPPDHLPWVAIRFLTPPTRPAQGGCEELLSPKTIKLWADHYPSLSERVRILPGRPRDLEVLMRVFYAYMGAIHQIKGYQARIRLHRSMGGQVIRRDPPS